MGRSTPRPTWIGWSLLGAIVLVAIGLRFWRIEQRGLLFWDEGKFCLEGLRLSGLLFHTDVVGKTVGTAKPTHALLIALAYALFGMRDASALFLNAFCSVLSVVCIYLIGRRLFDEATALLAALFLTVSEYDVLYARSVLSESDAVLCFLLAVLVWMSSAHSDRVVSRLLPGIVGGVAFTINYRLIVYLFALICIDVLHATYRGGLKQGARYSIGWIVGLLVVPLGWQALDLAAGSQHIQLFRNELTGRRVLYMQEVLYQLHEGKQSQLQFQPLIYLEWYAVRQGPVACILLLAGFLEAVRRRSLPLLLPVGLILLPYLAFVFASFVVPRNLVVALPFASLLAAIGLRVLARSVPAARLRTAGVVLLAILSAGFGIILSANVTAQRSGLSRAAEYIQAHGDKHALSTTEVTRFYLQGESGCGVLRIPRTSVQLKADVQAGYHYILWEHTPGSIDPAVLKTLRALPVAVRYPLIGARILGENIVDSEHGAAPDMHASDGSVVVYQLSGAGTSMHHIQMYDSCDIDQVL